MYYPIKLLFSGTPIVMAVSLIKIRYDGTTYRNSRQANKTYELQDFKKSNDYRKSIIPLFTRGKLKIVLDAKLNNTK